MAKSSAKAKKTEIVESVEQENLPAVSAAFDLGNFEVAAMVTLPTFKIKDNEVFVFQADGTIYEGKKLKGDKATDDDGNPRKPVFLMPVTKINPESGETLKGQIVVGAVLKENLEEKYPDAGYVGKIFGVQKLGLKEGKRYKEYNVVELKRKK